MTQPTWPPPGAAEPTAGPPLQRMATQIDQETPDAAAFLDGLSDEDLALFAESLAIQRELEEQDAAAGEPGVIPLRPRERRSPFLDRRWILAAAVIAAVALVPLALRMGGGGALRTPSQAVALLAAPDAGLPENYDERPWSVTRGSGAPSSDERRAAQLGALAVDLELAIRSGDAKERVIIAERIRYLLTNSATAESLAAGEFAPLADSTATDRGQLLAVLRQASGRTAEVVGADRYALGAWAEAARFAAARQDADFFDARSTRAMLDRAADLFANDEQARGAIAGVREAATADPPDWPRLQARVDEMLRAIA